MSEPTNEAPTNDEPTEAAPAPRRRGPRRASRGVTTPVAPDPAVEAAAPEPEPEPAPVPAPEPEAPPEPSAEPADAEVPVEDDAPPSRATFSHAAPPAPERDADQRLDVFAAFGIGAQAATPEPAAADEVVPAPEPAAADEDDEELPEGAEDAEDGPRLPATALLFQAPEPRARSRRRASSPAGPPSPEDAGERPASPEHVDAPSEAAASDAPEAAERPKRRKRRKSGGSAEPEAPEKTEDAEQAATAAPDEDEPADGDAAEAGAEGEGRRRRRRGGRGRKKAAATDAEDEPASAAPDEAPEAEPDAESTSRRRRRRRSGRADDGARARDEVTALKGSTRLEAKRQRRREGRDAGRRRTIITEAEFLARREAVERAMVVRERDGRTQIAVLEDGVLVEHYVARKQQSSMVGNVYLGRVQNVLPSMEAAFVDLGKGRNAVLYAGEVNWDAAGLEGQPRRIEQALSSGDSVLVQVTKDPIGHKGARLTSQITLAGRYLVLVPSGAMTGISRKLPDTERARLKKLLKEIVPDGQGVIVRTAAEGASEDELRRDVERLTKQWADIQTKVNGSGGTGRKPQKVTAPALLKGEPELALRVVRDVFNEDFSSLTVSGDEAWHTISDYLTTVAPDLAQRLTHWTDDADVFARFRIDEQLAKGLDRKVWLPSGGSLVIDRTEAMTVVDVNTGKFTGSGGTLEETVTRNNLEAAEEIVRQLRLRDIGGIIVIDFIDMVLESNRDLVLRRLIECLGRDRTRHQVAEVTSLGLVQMTRKRVGQGLVEAFSETCEHCHGRGFVVHTEPFEAQPVAEEETPRVGRRRGSRSRGAAQPAQPAEDDASAAAREAVRATLATIAAAAQHAHESTDRPEGDDGATPSADVTPAEVDEVQLVAVESEVEPEPESQAEAEPQSEPEVEPEPEPQAATEADGAAQDEQQPADVAADPGEETEPSDA
ncbi:ribonuclease, Rne/Rng family [Beutenbergia cavernae DSM 12333]|uniref:Ribonuclease E n=1 Tax=Beutenbergia cavernae (strain ATCC BAA-8 / DSM 12333 / CCUG 43141 / JCM 11478 / NBRC 16432 / NCIMB 13614 / HKI 0122) TaxID=471853 RepID=C5C3H5_BEUC1|nr:ribonuclease, Rne/Rng family [Beutenbergia cavernae DSM 12333]